MILHYPGNVTNFDGRRIVGPDAYGGFWVPISAMHDPLTDRTRMVFAPVPPAAWPVGTKVVRQEWETAEQNRILTLALAGHRDSIKALVDAEQQKATVAYHKAKAAADTKPWASTSAVWIEKV